MIVEPRTRSRALRWVVGILLIGHGLIHLMGPLEIWDIADIDQMTGDPTLAIGDTATNVVATLWLVAMVILIAAGVAVIARRPWWRTMAVVGVVISQMAIIIWWGDAATGTIPNLLIVAAVVLAGRLGLTAGPQPG